MMLAPSQMSGLISSSPARLPNSWTHPVGIGDWSEPDCVPGSEGCVPHWYCYVPGAVTPDCLASFAQGVKASTSGVAKAAGGVVGAAVKGVVGGAADAVTGGGDGSGWGLPFSPFSAGTLLIAGAVGLGALIYFGGRR